MIRNILYKKLILVVVISFPFIGKSQLLGGFINGLGRVVGGGTNIVNSSYNVQVNSFNIYNGLLNASDELNGDYGFRSQVNTNQNLQRTQSFYNRYYYSLLLKEQGFIGSTRSLVKETNNVVYRTKNDALKSVTTLEDFKDYLVKIRNRYGRANSELDSYNDKLNTINSSFNRIKNSFEDVKGGLKEMSSSFGFKEGNSFLKKGFDAIFKSSKGVAKAFTKFFGADDLLGLGSKKVEDDELRKVSQNQINIINNQLKTSISSQKLLYKSTISLENIEMLLQEQKKNELKKQMELGNKRLVYANSELRMKIILLQDRQLKRKRFIKYLINRK